MNPPFSIELGQDLSLSPLITFLVAPGRVWEGTADKLLAIPLFADWEAPLLDS